MKTKVTSSICVVSAVAVISTCFAQEPRPRNSFRSINYASVLGNAIVQRDIDLLPDQREGFEQRTAAVRKTFRNELARVKALPDGPEKSMLTRQLLDRSNEKVQAIVLDVLVPSQIERLRSHVIQKRYQIGRIPAVIESTDVLPDVGLNEDAIANVLKQEAASRDEFDERLKRLKQEFKDAVRKLETERLEDAFGPLTPSQSDYLLEILDFNSPGE